MGRFILKRLLQMLLLVFLISVVVFFMLRIVPGDPVDVLLGEISTRQEDRDRLRAQWGLDKPVYQRIFSITWGNWNPKAGLSV